MKHMQNLTIAGRVTLTLFTAALSALVLISCGSTRASAAPLTISGSRFVIDITPGSSYKSSQQILFFKEYFSPQIACWIETPDGKYVQTLYVTAKVASGKFYAAPSAGRPEALPVWSHAAAGNAAPADAISGATPGGTTHHESAAPHDLVPGRYIAKLEVNDSYDYNARYTRSNAGVNGQPSVVYQAEITVGQTPSTGTFAAIGTGSLDGANGAITPGFDGLTTALQIIGAAQIQFLGE